MEFSSKIILVCFSLMAFVAVAEGMQCIACKSTENENCTDVLTDEKVAMSMLKDCGKLDDSCMKIITRHYSMIKGKQQLTSKIVNRFCAEQTEEQKNGCIQYLGAGGTVEACRCQGNHCNAATISSISFGLLLMSVLTYICHQF